MHKPARAIFLAIVALTLSATTGYCQCDNPDTSGWSGSAYHGDWFSYQLKAPYSDGIVKLDTSTPFILSPKYPRPIRKLIVQLKCNSASPSRTFTAIPLVDGVETSDPPLMRKAESVSAADKLEYAHFDWPETDNVTAVRLCLSGSGDGVWGVGEIYVFHGEKTADEDALVRELVKTLPPPGGLHAESLSSSSLTLAAGEVEFAGGYRFSLERLEGTALSEEKENFADAPQLNNVAWTVETENAKLGVYTSSGNCDVKYSDDESALKIESSTKADEPVSVTFTSASMPSAITELRYMYKVGTEGKSNRFTVYARAGGSDDWTEIETVTPTSAAKTYVTNRFERASGYSEVKLVFSARGDDFTVTTLDSLSVIYGGDEERVGVAVSEPQSSPRFTAENLDQARYAAKVMALSADGAAYSDSPWSDECIIDLAWADIVVSAPKAVRAESEDGKLKISWSHVAGAEHYLIDVFTSGYPQEHVISQLKASASPVAVDLPTLGEYEVKVTAVSPGGCSTAASGNVTAALELGAVETVEWQVADADKVKLDWSKVHHAEGYRVKTYSITGSASTERTDYSGLPEIWPAGWTHNDLISESYSTPAPKIRYHGSWMASPAAADAITKVKYSFKSHASEEITAMTLVRMDVSSSSSGDDWREGYASDFASRAKSEREVAIPYSENVRRIRFTVLIEPADVRYAPLLEMGEVQITCGQEIPVETASMQTQEPGAVIAGLSPEGRYVFEVTPLPSEGSGLSRFTDTIDMSLMKPRQTSAMRLSTIRTGTFDENFSSLAAITAETPLREIPLPYWQFRKGDDEPDTLKYTKTGNATAGGVYVLSDSEQSENSFALGTLSTSSYGCAFGIAFTNDLSAAVENPEIAFSAIQRSFKSSPKSFILEYVITDGDIAISAEGEWRQLEIPATAPLTTDTRGEKSEHRQDLGPYTLPVRIPVGGVLIIRYRDPKGAASPMMSIDDFRFRHPQIAEGMILTVR